MIIDLAKLLDAAKVAGIPLLSFVIGLTEWVKAVLKLQGAAAFTAAMIVGLALGVAYSYATVPLVTFSDWFTAVTFGILLGLGASGLFNAATSVIKRSRRSS